MNHVNNLVGGMGRIRFLLLVLMAISLGLWIVFAQLIVPPVIESAYRGESLPVLNNIIEGQDKHPVGDYLQDWDAVTVPVLLIILGFWLAALVMSSPAFFRRYVGEATPGSLGAIRALTCTILLIATFLEDLPSIVLLPVEMRQPIGMMRFFYALPIGFERFVTSETSLQAFKLLTELILFLGVIGWRTRVVIPLGAFCHFLQLGILIDYSFFWHQYWVPLFLMAILSWTPCGDGWSVDRLWKVYQGRAVPDADRASPIYGWSRYACWVAIAIPYVATGLSKLRDGGLFWWNATNMRSILYFDTLTPREFDWALSLYLAPAPDILFALLGITTILGEISFGMVLFSRTARQILPIVMMMMHIGILLLQRILFFDLILLQLVFFDFAKIRKAVGRWLAVGRGRIQVLYDGLCPLCRRTVRLLVCFDLFARLEFLDFRRLELTEYNRNHALDLRPGDLEQEMYVISRGRTYRGFYGYRTIALALPAFWPFAPWLFLPGISSLGTLVYEYVARNRAQFLRCGSQCVIEPSAEASGSTVTMLANNPAHSFRFPLAISGIAIVALLCWIYRIEFYPFTAWHLYAGSDTSGKITYYKVFAGLESGVTSRARLEDAIGAMAFDNRYWPAIDKCFGQPSDVCICKKFLGASGSAYNKKARPGERIMKYEIQLWTWHFRSNPLDPHYGNLTDRFIHEIIPGGGTEKAVSN